MAVNVESIFYVREKPWHGLGIMVAEAPDSAAALRLSGLDWNVIQKDIMTVDGGTVIPGFKANVRDTDGSVLGIVTDRYRVVQNMEAFSFTDALLGEGVRYETAGSLQGGRRTWILARLPHQYIINGEEITPYLVFMNAHDGSHDTRAGGVPEHAEPGAFHGKAELELQPHRRHQRKAGRGAGHAPVCRTVYG